MVKIDTSNIKRLTKEKITFAIYEREEKMKKKKLAHLTIAIAVFSIIIGGTFTANALTDNKIADTITEKVKTVLRVKTNGNEYEANCYKETNGSITCTLPEELTGKGTEAKINVADEYLDKIDLEYNESEDGTEVETSIKINK